MLLPVLLRQLLRYRQLTLMHCNLQAARGLCDQRIPKTYMSPDTPFSALNNESSLQLQSRIDQVVKSGAMLILTSVLALVQLESL